MGLAGRRVARRPLGRSEPVPTGGGRAATPARPVRSARPCPTTPAMNSQVVPCFPPYAGSPRAGGGRGMCPPRRDDEGECASVRQDPRASVAGRLAGDRTRAPGRSVQGGGGEPSDDDVAGRRFRYREPDPWWRGKVPGVSGVGGRERPVGRLNRRTIRLHSERAVRNRSRPTTEVLTAVVKEENREEQTHDG
jgi:hypothetical protein